MRRVVVATMLCVSGYALGSTGPVQQVSGDWLVDLRTVFAVGGVVIPLVWWLSRALTKFGDRIETLEAKIKELPCDVCRYPNEREEA